MAPGLAVALQWPCNRSQCFLQSILLLEWFKVNWSSHSSCQNSFPSFRVNSKVWHQGPSACFFSSVYTFLPENHRALSLTSFRLLLKGPFLRETCSDYSIENKVASTTITFWSVLLLHGTYTYLWSWEKGLVSTTVLTTLNCAWHIVGIQVFIEWKY